MGIEQDYDILIAAQPSLSQGCDLFWVLGDIFPNIGIKIGN